MPRQATTPSLAAFLRNVPVLFIVRSGRAHRPRVAQVERPLRRALTGSDAEIPRSGETIVRTVMVGSADTVTAARLHADTVITPTVDAVGLMEWSAIARVRESGRVAARRALEADPSLPDRLGT